MWFCSTASGNLATPEDTLDNLDNQWMFDNLSNPDDNIATPDEDEQN